MVDSPLTIVLLGISAASAIASLIARRRSRPTPLGPFSDEDLFAALVKLTTTNSNITPQPHAPVDCTTPAFVSHPLAEMREVVHSESVRSQPRSEDELRRSRLLIIEEIERRRG